MYKDKAVNAGKLKIPYLRSHMESKKSPHHKEAVKFHPGSIGERLGVIRALLRVVHWENKYFQPLNLSHTPLWAKSWPPFSGHAPIFKKLQLRAQKELEPLE